MLLLEPGDRNPERYMYSSALGGTSETWQASPAARIYLVVALSWERSIRDMVLTKAKTFLDCEVVGIDSRLFSSRSVPLREETVLELDTTAAWVGRVVPRASVETSISLSLFRILWVVLASHSVLRLPQL